MTTWVERGVLGGSGASTGRVALPMPWALPPVPKADRWYLAPGVGEFSSSNIGGGWYATNFVVQRTCRPQSIGYINAVTNTATCKGALYELDETGETGTFLANLGQVTDNTAVGWKAWPNQPPELSPGAYLVVVTNIISSGVGVNMMVASGAPFGPTVPYMSAVNGVAVYMGRTRSTGASDAAWPPATFTTESPSTITPLLVIKF